MVRESRARATIGDWKMGDWETSEKERRPKTEKERDWTPATAWDESPKREGELERDDWGGVKLKLLSVKSKITNKLVKLHHYSDFIL